MGRKRQKTAASPKLKTVRRVSIKMSKSMDIIHSGAETSVIATSLCNLFVLFCFHILC